MEEALITIVVFAGIYQIIKMFTDFLLKRRIVKSGHVDKAEILEVSQSQEVNRYPTLKWGLVALFAGLGLLVIAVINKDGRFDWHHETQAYLSFGIELIAISLGFLAYFFISKPKSNG